MPNIIETSTGPEIDFSAISAKVSEHLQSLGTPPTAEPTQDTTTPLTQRTQAAPEQAPVSVDEKDTPPSVVTLPDGTKVSVNEIEEWRKGNMRQADYTQKTQEVAEMRRAAGEVFKAYQQMQQERQELVEFLNNPQQIAAYLAQQFGQPSQDSQLDPNHVPTVGDVQQLTQREIARLQGEMRAMQQEYQRQMQEVAKSTKVEIQQEREELEYAQKIDHEFSGIFNEYPILKSIPNAEHSIRLAVFQQNPSSPEEMYQALWETAQTYVNQIEQTWNEVQQAKTTAARAESLSNNNTAPPGGQGLQPEPVKSRYDSKKNSIDWKSIQADALSYINTRQ